MKTEREQFEKLPEIEERVHWCYWDESTQQYCANVSHDDEWEYHTNFINGAYYAFQECQKQLVEQKQKIDTLKVKANDALEAFNDGAFNYCQKQLEEILNDT